MSPYHASALKYKVNQLARLFMPSRWLSAREFRAYALNFLAMGNSALQRLDSLSGRPMTLKNTPSVYLRVGKPDDTGFIRYFWVPGYRDASAFPAGSIFHLIEDDLLQEIYGVPAWLSALQSGLLAEAATIFRRRYYINGSHAGYILYINEEKFAEADSDELEKAVAASKGPGNFRNVYLHIPAGKKDGVQVIPIGETTAKDEFANIKAATRDDVLAAHRVPPVLLGIIPQNTGGLGDPGKAADAFHFAEIEPLQQQMAEVNDWLGVEAVMFKPYERQAQPAAAAPAK